MLEKKILSVQRLALGLLKSIEIDSRVFEFGVLLSTASVCALLPQSNTILNYRLDSAFVMLVTLIPQPADEEPNSAGQCTALAVASTTIKNDILITSKKVYLSRKLVISRSLQRRHKTVVDVSENEDSVLEISCCSFFPGSWPATGFGIGHVKLDQGSQSDLEELSFTKKIELTLDNEAQRFIRGCALFPETSLPSLNLHLEFLQPWQIDPFPQLPTELLAWCLREMLDNTTRIVNFRTIQDFRLVCRRFNVVGITKICELAGAGQAEDDAMYESQRCLDIIHMFETWGGLMAPWIRQLILFRLHMKTSDAASTWNTLLSLLSQTVNLVSLVIQLPTPSRDRAPFRNRFFVQVGTLRHLRVLVIVSWGETEAGAFDQWNTEDLCLLLKQPLATLVQLHLADWDLIPLPQSSLQPLPRAKLIRLTIEGSSISKKVIQQILPYMPNIMAWEPIFIDGPKGREERHREPLPLTNLYLHDNWIPELQFEDVLELLQYHGKWLSGFTFTLQSHRHSSALNFEHPLDEAFNPSVHLTSLHLDGLHELSGILTPQFFQFFQCSLVEKLSIYYCPIPIIEISQFLRRRRARKAPKSSDIRISIRIRTFFNDEVSRSVNLLTIQDQFSDLQATIEAGTGEVPTDDDFQLRHMISFLRSRKGETNEGHTNQMTFLVVVNNLSPL
ncbi:hypothetical protein BT69DRAFT_1322606 [Atractiella rhizophila]|nr:hypothetical protein BT69DRAFT_1322606 [Atractiella rhizophila]